MTMKVAGFEPIEPNSLTANLVARWCPMAVAEAVHCLAFSPRYGPGRLFRHRCSRPMGHSGPHVGHYALTGAPQALWGADKDGVGFQDPAKPWPAEMPLALEVTPDSQRAARERMRKRLSEDMARDERNELRDRFAAAALTGIWAIHPIKAILDEGTVASVDDALPILAERCYAIADAMLTARQRPVRR